MHFDLPTPRNNRKVWTAPAITVVYAKNAANGTDSNVVDGTINLGGGNTLNSYS
jgi:hypothetical protein